jgi:2-polyprenyl-6-hydroxyphenyl methylase/3-demethylubiquinone-9 3-methyltransferase
MLRPKLAGVATTVVRGQGDVRAFFDRCASAYTEQHGRAERLLAYRLGLIRVHACPRPDDVVLDVGCGPGDHLFGLAPELRQGIGVDLSPAMIATARARAEHVAEASRLSFAVDDASVLAGIRDASIDLALCIGALEHVLDKPAALASIHRALKPGGRLFCLTPDADYVWYRHVAPLLGLPTKHLSTDCFLDRESFTALLRHAGYGRIATGAWTFIPKGDMPRLAATALGALDLFGRVARLPQLRGGLWACAWCGG